MKKLHRHLETVEGKFVLGVAIIIILLLGYYFYATPSKDNNKIEEITISETDHVRGKQDAKLTLVEFGDYQCPACGVYEQIIRQVAEDNKGILKVVFRHFPLTQIHQNAILGAKAAEAAGLQGKFWEMHEMLFDKQDEWSKGMNAHDFILTYATTLGLNTKKFSEDLKNEAIEEKIMAEYKEGVKLGVQGTPTFFLNGKKIDNPSSLEAFNKLILETAANLPK
jgi:protein-disulfide isomerase